METKDCTLRKKLLYRAVHRGCKETDIIIGRFVEKNVDLMDLADIKSLELLLDIDDSLLYSWFTGKTQVDSKYDTKLFRNIEKFWQVERVSRTHKVYVICGEASGDFIASKMLSALHERCENLEMSGVGGALCEKEGLHSIFDYKELSIMGIAEIIPSIPRILMRIRQVVRDIINFDPDVIVTVDSPGFTFRVLSKLRAMDVETKAIHYVAPTVWAYNPERAGLVARLYNHILLILPFEQPYFDKVGMESTFVGHPSVEKIRQIDIAVEKPKDEKWLVIMPGSRKQEISQMKKIFVETIKQVQRSYQGKLRVFLPTFPHLVSMFRDVFSADVELITDDSEKEKIFQNADFALVKSGTSSVEMMFCGVPCVVVYKTSWFTYQIMKRKVKVPFMSICNLVLNKLVMPEFIQGECIPANIANALLEMLDNKRSIEVKADYAQCINMLKAGDEAPSQHAADVVMKYLRD